MVCGFSDFLLCMVYVSLCCVGLLFGLLCVSLWFGFMVGNCFTVSLVLFALVLLVALRLGALIARC